MTSSVTPVVVAAVVVRSLPTRGFRLGASVFHPRGRIIYSEILDNEQAVTAAAFWARVAAWFATSGIVCERVITDNGSCYRSRLWRAA